MSDRGSFIQFAFSLLPNLVFRALGSLSAFLVTYYVSASKNLDVTGVFFFYLACANILSSVTRLGTETLLLRDFGASGKTSNNAQRFISSCIITFSLNTIFFLSFILGKTLIEGVYWFTGDTFSIYFCFFIYLVFFSFNNTASMVLQGVEKSKSSIFSSAIGTNLFFIILSLAFSNNSIASISSLLGVSAVLTSMIVASVLMYHFKHIRFDRSILLKKIVIDSFPFWVINIMAQSAIWSGQIILGLISRASDVALYNASHKLALLTSFFLMAVNTLISPKIAKLSSRKNSNELKILFVDSSRLILLSTLPFVVIMLFFPEFLLGFFGEEYSGSSLSLRILALGQLFNVCCGSVGLILIMTGHEIEARKAAVQSGLIALLLHVSLIPLFGYIGAAVASSTGIIILNLMNVKSVKLKSNLDVSEIYFKKRDTR